MIKKINLMFSGVIILLFLVYLVSAANCGGNIACNCGDNLNASRTLNASDALTSCSAKGLNISSNNVTLDCNGSLINGTNSNSAISFRYVNNTIIKNCRISKFSYGVFGDYFTNLTVTNTTVINSNIGVSVNYAFGNISLMNNNLSSNTDYGIYIYNSETGSIINCNCYNNSRGINILYSNVSIINSNAYNNSQEGVRLYNDDNYAFSATIINNSIYLNGYSGITSGFYLLDVNLSRIYNNTYNGINIGNQAEFRNVPSKLRVTDSNITNNNQDGIFVRQLTTDSSYNITNNRVCGNLGAGGQVDSSCPFVFAWNGKNYEFVNDAFPLGKLWFLNEVPWILKILVKIGILSDVPGIRDTTYTKIPFALEEKNGKYELKVSEQYDERSYFDSIELMIVDHSSDYEIYPNRYGNDIITTSKNLISPVSCIDNYGNNCLSLIKEQDNNVKKLKKNDYLIIDFGDLSNAEKIKMIISKGAVGAQNVKRFEVLDKNGNWKEADYKLGKIVNLYGFPTTQNVFDLTNLFPTSEFKIKIFAEDLPFLNKEFDERLMIDYIGIDTSKPKSNFKTTILKPSYAKLSKGEVPGFWSETKIFEGNGYELPKYSQNKETRGKNITKEIAEDDCNMVNIKNCENQVIMEFGDEITANYDIPSIENGMERDFIIITNGAYEKLPSSGHTDIFVSIGYSLSGSSNTCDTTWNYNDNGVSKCTNSCSLTYFAGGIGTSNNPYQIENCQQLQYTTYNLTANYILNNNINCSNTTTWNYDKDALFYRGFAPIGAGHNDAETNREPFTGTFNGNNYNITDLYINSYRTSIANYNYAGLFGIIGSGAVVKNLGLVNVNISGGYYNDALGGTGALAAYSTGDSTINNTFSTGNVNGKNYVGGLVGSHGYDPGACFAAGTKILLQDNTFKNIEDVKEGDIVISYNEITQEKLNARVVKTFKHITNFYLIINNKLQVTPNHPMYSNGEWKEAGELKINDYLFDENNNLVKINSIIYIENLIEVYNLEVDSQINSEEFCGPGHSYYANGFLAHNKCPRVYTNNGSDYEFDSLLSVYHIGKYSDGIFNYTLKKFNSPIIRVDYDPNEINYLDMIEIHAIDTSINKPNKTQILKPIACNPSKCDLNSLSDIDKNYLRLDENNKQIFLDFGSIPEIEPGYNRTYLILSSGYSDIINAFTISDFPDYIQKWLREYNKYLHSGEEHHTITNSYSICNVNGTDYIGGLVGYHESNQVINNSYAKGNVTGQQLAGGLVGNSWGIIDNCYATGNVTTSTYYAGGLIGGIDAGNVSNSYATGNVYSPQDYIGGLVGNSPMSIINCSASGNVSGRVHVGGLVGACLSSGAANVTNSYATGNVSGTGNSVGGLAGDCDSLVNNSYARGNVIGGGNNVAGFIGYVVPGLIYNSYATGNVSGTGNYVGGFVGYVGATIQNSYSTGNVSGSGSYNGGFVGYFEFGEISNSYWYSGSSELNSSGNTVGSIGCTAISQSTGINYFYTITNLPMNSWDFTNIWSNANNGIDYPILGGQGASASAVPNNAASSSSSGGGSTSQIYNTNEIFQISGNTFGLRFNDKINFIVNYTNHTLTMQNFNSTTAKVIIQSNPFSVYLQKGVLYEFDVSNDNINDFRVRYNGLNGTEAMIFVQEIISTSKESGSQLNTNNSSNLKLINDNNFIILNFILVLIIGIILFFIIYKPYKKTRYH